MNRNITILWVSVSLAALSACGGGGGEAAASVASVQPPGRFAFVANTLDNTVSSYRVDARSGELFFNGYTGAVIGQVAPGGVILHPSGRWLYTPNLGNAGNGSNISVYAIDADTGALNVRIPAGVGSGPFDMAFDPSGEHLYVAAAGSNAIWSYSVHPQTGELTLLGQPTNDGFAPMDLAVHPGGEFLFAAYRGSGLLVTYDIDEFQGTLSSRVTPEILPSGQPVEVAIAPDGEHLYVCDRISERLIQYTVDSDTGGLDALTSRLIGGEPTDLALDPSGRFLVVLRARGSVRVFALDPSSGSPALVDDDVEAGTDPVQASFDAAGRRLFVTNRGSNDVTLFDVDPSTGELTAAGQLRARAEPAGFAIGSDATRPRTVEGQFVFVANQGSDSITGYRIDPSSGTLGEIAGGGTLTGLTPRSIAADPLGRFVYTVNVDSPSVSVFAVDPATGALSASAAPLPYNGQPRAIAVDPSGRFAFVANAVGSVEAFGIDRATGALDFRGTTPSGGQDPQAITVDPTGQFIYVSNFGTRDVTAMRFDQGFLTAGSFQVVSRVTTVVNGPATSVRFAPDGARAYVSIGGEADQVLPMDVDPVNGQLVLGIAGMEDGEDPFAAVVHPLGTFAFAAVRGVPGPQGDPGEVRAFEIRKSDGALTSAESYFVGVNPVDIALEAGGRYLYVLNGGGHDITTFKLDPVTGELAERGVVPTDSEPASMVVTSRIR